MFTALGSPKGASIGLSAAALIIAVSYSLCAAPTRVTVDVARSIPNQPAVTQPSPVARGVAPVIQVAEVALDDIVTGSISDADELGLVQPKASGGSAGFLSALDLIKDKKYADAYEKARGLANDVERRTIQWAAIT